MGELLLVGPGAGGAATASSVCADLVDIARNPAESGPALGVPASQLNEQALIPSEQIASEWYVRLTAADQPGVMSDITQVLASHDISIESMLQKPPASGSGKVRIVLLTHMAPQSVMTDALHEITALGEVEPDFALMRAEAFNR